MADLLSLLKDVTRNGSGWTARCPAHDDQHRSLSIDYRDNRWLLKCHAGCSWHEIVDALGLKPSDLFDDRQRAVGQRTSARDGRCRSSRPSDPSLEQPLPQGLTVEQYAAAKALPITFLEGCGLSNTRFKRGPAVSMPYLGSDGQKLAVRFRIALEGDRFRWRRGDSCLLYGLDRLTEAQEAGYVFLVEGESDCHTLWLHGILALGVPGASNWNDERDAQHLDGIETIFAVIEPDRGGDAFRELLANSILRSRVKIILLPTKDISDLYLENPVEFIARLEVARSAAVSLIDSSQGSHAPGNRQEDGKDLGHDDLPEIVKKTAADQSAPFAPEMLKRLGALKKKDRAAFESLRLQLKEVGCRVAELDNAIAEEHGSGNGRRPTQADLLIGLAQAAEFFHGSDDTSYADIEFNGHRETWPIRSKGFRRWLARAFFEATGGAPNSEALQSALNVLEAKAHFDGPERQVFIRVGGHDGRIYLDLRDDAWRVVEIDAAGWRVTQNPPVRFRRTAGMQPLPVPVGGGSISMLRLFLNVRSEADFALAVSWLIAALRNRGPYPVLVVSGEQGSTKTTFSGMMRALIDPNSASLQALPRNDRDLFIAAVNAHVLAFDNVSGLPPWISDTLCRLATGGGFAVRQLYTDQEQVLFEATRPAILNGIEDVVTRPDLADRSLLLMLEPIPEGRRRPEAELWRAFKAERPKILGALLDAVAVGLERLPHTRLERLPRMADFALWVTACEPALWEKGTFITAYTGNIEEATKTLIEADIVAPAVLEFMAEKQEWTGSAKDLLSALGGHVGDAWVRKKDWPKTPKSLSGCLTRLAPPFRRIGLKVSRLPRQASMRPIHLEWSRKRPSFASASSGKAPFRNSSNSVADETSLSADDHDDGSVSHEPLGASGHDAHDATDGQKLSYSSSPDGDPFAPLTDPKWALQAKKKGNASD